MDKPSPVSDTESSDIEIVSISVSNPRVEAPARGPISEMNFICSEIMDGSHVITSSSLKRALMKYEVEATDEQVLDMMNLLDETGALLNEEKIQLLYERCMGSS